MAFVLEQVVEALDYDFRPKVDSHGTIPEPSDIQIDRFMKRYYSLMSGVARATETQKVLEESEALTEDAAEDEPKSIMDAIDAWETLDVNTPEAQRISEKLAEVLADVCSNTPSKEDILALGTLGRKAFTQWILGELLDPKFDLPGKSSTNTSPGEKTTV